MRNAEKDKCIPYQLQRLFVNLYTSRACALPAIRHNFLRLEQTSIRMNHC